MNNDLGEEESSCWSFNRGGLEKMREKKRKKGEREKAWKKKNLKKGADLFFYSMKGYSSF